MVVHHIIRCCCVFIPSTSSNNTTSSSSGGSIVSDQAIRNAAAQAPSQISLGLGEDGLILYAFIVCFGRLPTSLDVCFRKKIGAWAVNLRDKQLAGGLTKEQLDALRVMPKWPQPQMATAPPVYSQPSTEKSALITN